VSSRIARLVQSQWQHGGWLSNLLWPLATLTRMAVGAKRLLHAAGVARAWRAPVPVIVVGNVYVGGTGKTPVVIAIVQALRQRGWTPGIVSRGYGVEVGPHPRVGNGDVPPARFGDEPALIAHATGCPVAVHPRRALAAQALLAAHPRIDVIVSDDGLQHLALARDIEIAVQDERGIGNGRLLPAGPLREPPRRLDSVDAVVNNVAAPVPLASSRATHAHAGPRRLSMWLEPRQARRLTDGALASLEELRARHPGQRIGAAAGIGNPQRFFATLRAAGIDPQPALALPDHYGYAESPFRDWRAEVILVTSKDAIKCRALNDPRVWEVPATAHFSDPAWFDWLACALPARRKLH
jgi:tetraacyldisaccharide 4'-kinase